MKYILLLFSFLLLHAEGTALQYTKISRLVVDTRKVYGKNCETYSYLSAMERLKLIRHSEYLFGDLLSDIPDTTVTDPSYRVEENTTACESFDSDINQYDYNEELSYLSPSIVTITISQYQFGAGAAHGNVHNARYLYDRSYGMAISWEDLFKEDDAFDILILQRVVRELADEKFLAYFKSEEKLLNYRLPGYFGIEKEGLVIQYGKYEIAPGGSGLPSLTIPKTVLKKYMRPGMYAKCFVKAPTQKIREARNGH